LAAVWIAGAAARGAIASRWVPALIMVSAVGALSKQSFVIAPLLFGLYDWCFIARGRAGDMMQRWPAYVILIAIGVAGGAWGRALNTGEMAGFDIEGLPYWQYPLWQFGVLVYYLRLVVVPDRLCFDCGYFGPWPVFDSHLGEMVVLPALLLMAIGAASWLARRRAPLVTFCFWGAAIVLAPTSSIFPLADVYVEHRLYLPIAMLALVVVVSAFDAGQAALHRSWVPAQLVRAGQIITAAAVCLILGWLTVARNDVYASRLELYKDAVVKAPKSRRVQYNLANAYKEDGQLEKAIHHYVETIQLNPEASRGYVNLGVTYFALERYDDAILALEAARERQPGLGLIERNLAKLYLTVGEPDKAMEAAKRAVAAQPKNPRGRSLLAEAYEGTGQNDKALAEYRTVLRLQPRNQVAKKRIEALTGTEK
jgi:tetratricopeptide (TPR) repeat protein